METKKVLVVIDVQNDFITDALRNEEAIKVVPEIAKKIRDFKGDYIFVTRDTHEENYMETNEGKKLPVVHCVDGTKGWYIEETVWKALHEKELREEAVVRYFNKPTFGSFELAEAVKGIDGELDIEFVGFCTDICVVSNALMVKAAVYDRANVKVNRNLCAGVTPETHEAALTTMKMCQIDVI